MVDLDELARLEQAATPGPWTFFDRCGKGPDGTDDFVGYEVEGPPQADRGQFERGADAVFIAASRNALPALLALARAGERLAAAVSVEDRRFAWEGCPQCGMFEEHAPGCELAAALAAWRAAKEGR